MKNKKIIFIIAMAALVPAFALTTCKVQPAENDYSALALLMLMNRPGGGACECTGAEDCGCAVCDCDECGAVITHTVTFVSNGGSHAPEQEIAHGGKVTEPEVTKEDHMLAGWYRDPELTTEWNFDTDTVTDDIYLYAKWTEIPPGMHVVTFHNNGGLPHIHDQLIIDGGKVTLPETIAREDYIFAGWHRDIACTVEWDFDTDTVTDSIALYAKWTLAPFVITYSVSANNNTNTTAINFTFSGAVSLLSADEINISGNTGAAEKGALTRVSDTSWTLGVNVTTAGYVNVSIGRSGIHDANKLVYVYKGGVVQPSDITYFAYANGVPNFAETTLIFFTFQTPVGGLTAADITLTNGTGSVTKGLIGGGGAIWSLGVSVISAGDITVSINKSGIESAAKTVAVYKIPVAPGTITYSAVADDTGNTTAINFEFSAPVSGLTVQQVNIINNSTGVAVKGATLTGGGTSWSLGVTVVAAGDILVQINRSGIERPAKTVKVYKPIPDITYTAEADNISYTNAINFTFGAPVYGLTESDITITDDTGAAEVRPGSLTQQMNPAVWTLDVVVITQGNITVSIDKAGIENELKTAAVYRSATINYTAVPRGAADTVTTDFIDLTFSAPVIGLSAADITISSGTGMATTGPLNRISDTNWELSISNVIAGSVNITIYRTGVNAAQVTATVHKALATFIASVNGTADSVTTTAVTLTFNEAVVGLTAGEISISGTGSANITSLSASNGNMMWTLNVNNVTAGSVDISVSKTGIISTPQQVTLHRALVTYGAAANGAAQTTTTAYITLTFSESIDWISPALAAGDITLSAGVTKTGALNRISGTEWQLPVNVTSLIDTTVTVQIIKAGIVNTIFPPIPVYKALNDYTAVANNADNPLTTTTSIILTFDELITLAEYQPQLSDITFTVESGGPVTLTSFNMNAQDKYTLNINVTDSGTVNISITGKAGIKSDVKTVDVYKAAASNTPTAGLLYEEIGSTGEYEVSIGTATNVTDIIIASVTDPVRDNVAAAGSVTRIKNNGFSFQNSWTSVISSIVIPDSITHIGDRAFNNCSSLQSIELPDSITHIGTSAFEYCFYKNTGYGSNPLQDEEMIHITIPDSVLIIGNRAFFECNKIKSITIGSSVETIGNEAFNIGSDATGGLKGTPLPLNPDNIGPLVIPGSVSSIGNNAFNGNGDLTGITIESSGSNMTIGNYAFNNTSLTSLVLPDRVTSIGQCLFVSGYSESYPSLTSITIGSGITEIPYYAFAGTAIEEINIPNTVETIGGSAFYNCSSLESVTIGSGVKKIGAQAFNVFTTYFTSKLTTVTFAAGSSITNSTTITDPSYWVANAFMGVTDASGLRSRYFTAGNGPGVYTATTTNGNVTTTSTWSYAPLP